MWGDSPSGNDGGDERTLIYIDATTNRKTTFMAQPPLEVEEEDIH